MNVKVTKITLVRRIQVDTNSEVTNLPSESLLEKTFPRETNLLL